MAIQKMEFLKIVGSVGDMHEVLERLVLCEKLHFDFEGADAYDNSYIIHEYESKMAGAQAYQLMDDEVTEAYCDDMEHSLEHLLKGLGIGAQIDKKSILDAPYSIHDAHDDLSSLIEHMGPRIDEINKKRAEISKYEQFRDKMGRIAYKNMDFIRVAGFNYFDYEIGTLSRENRLRLRKNYENISAVALNVGTSRDKESIEDIYIFIYPKQFSEESSKLLKSLNWAKLDVPEDLNGSVAQMIEQADERIGALNREISELSKELYEKKDETVFLLNRINTTLKLEEKILELERELVFGGSTFVLNAWIRKGDRKAVEAALKTVLHKIIIEEKNPDELERQVTPPTLFKNNFFFKPFEKVIKLYGMPAYDEIDPTPFVAVTFCLMFGIMFGDIGQGLVYLIAGLLLSKKKPTIGQLLTRLGGSSIIFGFIYGSLFGLEQQELPWLPSLTGRPLDPANIPAILITGVVFGILVLTVSFIFGIINMLRKRNIEEGLFGKNGLAGYIFLMSLVMTMTAVTGVIGLSAAIPLSALVVSLFVMMLKVPLANLFTNNRPLIHGSVGSYLTESIFEGIETVLSSLSNAISFIRVGAFALNHAGLFLAFLVMSELTENYILKFIILILGNILILSLEGLVVFIQGLRLQYYEMFGKYFQGGGVAFKPAKINS